MVRFVLSLFAEERRQNYREIWHWLGFGCCFVRKKWYIFERNCFATKREKKNSSTQLHRALDALGRLVEKEIIRLAAPKKKKKRSSIWNDTFRWGNVSYDGRWIFNTNSTWFYWIESNFSISFIIIFHSMSTTITHTHTLKHWNQNGFY